VERSGRCLTVTVRTDGDPAEIRTGLDLIVNNKCYYLSKLAQYLCVLRHCVYF
jgi:hypothetical protein